MVHYVNEFDAIEIRKYLPNLLINTYRKIMNSVYKLEHLSDKETAKLLQAPKFNSLKPLNCYHCGHKGGDFSRKIFRIIGVPNGQQNDDEIQNLLTHFISTTHGIDHVFFKSSGRKFYADSARCPKCQSTQIVFDIEFTDDVFRQIAEKLGKPVEEVKRDITEITEKIRSSEAKKSI